MSNYARPKRHYEFGAAADTTPSDVKLLKFDTDRILALVPWSAVGQGTSVGGFDVVAIGPSYLKWLGNLTTSGDNSGNCENSIAQAQASFVELCFRYEGKISVMPGRSGFPDLQVHFIGNEPQGDDGMQVRPVSDRSFQYSEGKKTYVRIAGQ